MDSRGAVRRSREVSIDLDRHSSACQVITDTSFKLSESQFSHL